MGSVVEIVHEGRISRFVLQPVERKALHGFKHRVALDENGQKCHSALLSRDGRFLLPAGSTAETYLDANGEAVKRSELVAVDADGNPLPTLPATTARPQTVEGPITLDDFLGHVVTRVYALEAETLDPALEAELHAGAVFRVPYRPRPAHTETPVFLLANEHGVFIVQAEPCQFDFLGLEQTVSEADAFDDSEADLDEDDDEFAFDLDLEADHAVA